MDMRLNLVATLLLASVTLFAEDSPLTAAEAKKLKSSIPYSKKSITQGRSVFMRSCVGCHGSDGKSQVDVVADATDLTAPKERFSPLATPRLSFRSRRFWLVRRRIAARFHQQGRSRGIA